MKKTLLIVFLTILSMVPYSAFAEIYLSQNGPDPYLDCSYPDLDAYYYGRICFGDPCSYPVGAERERARFYARVTRIDAPHTQGCPQRTRYDAPSIRNSVYTSRYDEPGRRYASGVVSY